MRRKSGGSLRCNRMVDENLYSNQYLRRLISPGESFERTVARASLAFQRSSFSICFRGSCCLGKYDIDQPTLRIISDYNIQHASNLLQPCFFARKLILRCMYSVPAPLLLFCFAHAFFGVCFLDVFFVFLFAFFFAFFFFFLLTFVASWSGASSLLFFFAAAASRFSAARSFCANECAYADPPSEASATAFGMSGTS